MFGPNPLLLALELSAYRLCALARMMEEQDMMKNYQDDLGRPAKDVVSGFEGTVMGITFYLTGCAQYLISPKAKDGELKEGGWFDESRVKVDYNKPKLMIGNAVTSPQLADNGPDKPAPKK